MQSREELVKAIIGELNHLPEKDLTTVYEMIQNFRADILSEKIHTEKDEENEWIDEIKRVQEQNEHLRQDKSGNQYTT